MPPTRRSTPSAASRATRSAAEPAGRNGRRVPREGRPTAVRSGNPGVPRGAADSTGRAPPPTTRSAPSAGSRPRSRSSRRERDRSTAVIASGRGGRGKARAGLERSGIRESFSFPLRGGWRRLSVRFAPPRSGAVSGTGRLQIANPSGPPEGRVRSPENPHFRARLGTLWNRAPWTPRGISPYPGPPIPRAPIAPVASSAPASWRTRSTGPAGDATSRRI